MADERWRARYETKRLSVQAALARIQRGDNIFIGAGCGEPQALVRGLTELPGRLADSNVYHLLALGTAPYTAPRHNPWFIGHDVRSDVAERRADYTPVFLSEVPALFTQRHIPVDVALIQVSPPDDHGTCSYGVAVDITKPAAESARVRIAQVNRYMPRPLGDSFIHIDEIDVIVGLDEPILTAPAHESPETSREIGRQVAKSVEDGSCLQVGIGSVTGAMLDYLHGRRDWGSTPRCSPTRSSTSTTTPR